MTAPYVKRILRNPEASLSSSEFPGNLPFVAGLNIEFETPVTFFVGENGSGKSTLLEALAVGCGLPISGGSRNEVDERHGHPEQSLLARAIRVGFGMRPPDGYFFRAELQAHFASLLDRRRDDPEFRRTGGTRADPYRNYGGGSLHTRSHGEAFLAVMQSRFSEGLFLLDEPESALSPQRQLALLVLMLDLVRTGRSQFVVATHSPILLTFPGARIVSFDEGPLTTVSIEETSHYQITKGILEKPEAYWRHLLETGE